MPKTPTPITERLNNTRLIEVVAADLGVSKDTASAAVMATFNAVARAVASGHSVAITNFGTWLPYDTPARTAVNPQTGEPISIPGHQKMRFRVSPNLADAVRRKDRAATIRKAPKGSRTAKG